MNLVSADEIPLPPYVTPLENPIKLLAAAQQLELLCKRSRGMGLSASQAGLPWRLFVYWENFPKVPEKFSCLIDCEYNPASEATFKSIEGCLSLPGKKFELQRHDKINVKGKKLLSDGETARVEDFSCSFDGVAAVILQHEIDHDQGRERMIDKIGIPIHILPVVT